MKKSLVIKILLTLLSILLVIFIFFRLNSNKEIILSNDLNSENTERYEKSRPYHRKPEILKNHINNMSFGTKSILKKIMKRI